MSMENLNFSFMAFAAGKESTEASEIKRYIGVAPVFVLAVNPNKKELEDIYNTQIDNEPEYVSVVESGADKHKVEQVRLDFIVQTDKEKCGYDFKSKVTFFLKKEPRYNRDSTKIQVINKYGETAWLPVEDAKSGKIPENMSWFEAGDFRPLFTGEEELTNFIKSYLNIPVKSFKDKNGNIVNIPNKADAEARLDCINNYFKGDFSELKTVISLQPNNKVKCLFGVKTTDDNKLYQAVYTQMFLKNNVKSYAKLEEDVLTRKANGAYPTTEFLVKDASTGAETICELTEYEVSQTDLSQPNGAEMPKVDLPSWFD